MGAWGGWVGLPLPFADQKVYTNIRVGKPRSPSNSAFEENCRDGMSFGYMLVQTKPLEPAFGKSHNWFISRLWARIRIHSQRLSNRGSRPRLVGVGRLLSTTWTISSCDLDSIYLCAMVKFCLQLEMRESLATLVLYQLEQASGYRG